MLVIEGKGISGLMDMFRQPKGFNYVVHDSLGWVYGTQPGTVFT